VVHGGGLIGAWDHCLPETWASLGKGGSVENRNYESYALLLGGVLESNIV
jgi:hypothetical protein